MSGRTSRDKGNRGERAFAAVLKSRDWVYLPSGSGDEAEDGLAIDDGKTYAVEVKNTVTLQPAHLKQAMEQARKRGKGVRWLLAWHIPHTSSWLVQRQGERPVVWHGGEE